MYTNKTAEINTARNAFVLLSTYDVEMMRNVEKLRIRNTLDSVVTKSDAGSDAAWNRMGGHPLSLMALQRAASPKTQAQNPEMTLGFVLLGGAARLAKFRTTEKAMTAKKTMMISVLLLSTVLATPGFANYFSDARWDTNLNIGLTPNPSPQDVRVPPPLVVRKFIVFFDFNKSDLTAEARQVVQQAVTTAQQNGTPHIVITGYTDTVGSRAYHQRLSEHRAQSVKEEMERDGLNADDITTVGRIFSEPLVPTGPGIREPQDRRAVIELGLGALASARNTL
jgi:outer membrane protein OmpA-like peptidoglycan-associated protein